MSHMPHKVFYIHFANTIVPVKFTADVVIDDVRAAVNDALVCLDKAPLTSMDPIILRDVHGQPTEISEYLDELYGNEFFLDLGDGSWKLTQIIYSKMQENEGEEEITYGGEQHMDEYN
eukprot:Platyproteum_vivax@DN8003_c0_g1_i1.p1